MISEVAIFKKVPENVGLKIFIQSKKTSMEKPNIFIKGSSI